MADDFATRLAEEVAERVVQRLQDPGRLFTVKEAAAYLGRGERVMYQAMKDGQVRSVMIGGSRRTRRAWLDEFIADQEASER